MTRAKLLFPIAVTPMLVLLALQACSGDDNNGTDAAADGTTGVDATPDVAQDGGPDVQVNDSACPTYTGSVEFCKAAMDRCNACPGAVALNSCQRANFDALCNATQNVFSQQFASAIAACATVCDDDASSACQKASLADASLTTAQQKLVTDYCVHCSGNAGACGSQFGSQIVQYADPLVTSIDQQCAPDAGGPDSGACGAFNQCAGSTLLGALGSLPCADASAD